MIKAPIPENEEERLMAVKSLGVLDTKPEERFDRITKSITKKLNVPISLISIIDKDREWYKSCEGLGDKENDRGNSFCGHAMLSSEIFIVEDTLLDERFKDNPNVIGKPFIRFYAGVTLHDRKTHLPVGVLCVKDFKPRKLDLDEVHHLLKAAEEAEVELNKKGE